MAYNKSKGKQKHGDVIYDKDTDTQIDFEQNEIKFRTGGTVRGSFTNGGLSVTGSLTGMTTVSSSLGITGSTLYTDGTVWAENVHTNIYTSSAGNTKFYTNASPGFQFYGTDSKLKFQTSDNLITSSVDVRAAAFSIMPTSSLTFYAGENGLVSSSNNLFVGGESYFGNSGLTISSAGLLSSSATPTLVGLNVGQGAFTVSNEGAVLSATTIDAEGDLTAGTITMTGFTVDSDGDTVVKTISGSSNADFAGTLKAAGERFSVDADGDTSVKSLTSEGIVSGSTATVNRLTTAEIGTDLDTAQIKLTNNQILIDGAVLTSSLNTDRASFGGSLTSSQGRFHVDGNGAIYASSGSFTVASNGVVSASAGASFGGTLAAANSGFTVDSDGDTFAKSLSGSTVTANTAKLHTIGSDALATTITLDAEGVKIVRGLSGSNYGYSLDWPGSASFGQGMATVSSEGAFAAPSVSGSTVTANSAKLHTIGSDALATNITLDVDGVKFARGLSGSAAGYGLDWPGSASFGQGMAIITTTGDIAAPTVSGTTTQTNRLTVNEIGTDTDVSQIALTPSAIVINENITSSLPTRTFHWAGPASFDEGTVTITNDGVISGSSRIDIYGTLKAAGERFSVDADGDTSVKSLTSTGAISGSNVEADAAKFYQIGAGTDPDVMILRPAGVNVTQFTTPVSSSGYVSGTVGRFEDYVWSPVGHFGTIGGMATLNASTISGSSFSGSEARFYQIGVGSDSDLLVLTDSTSPNQLTVNGAISASHHVTASIGWFEDYVYSAVGSFGTLNLGGQALSSSAVQAHSVTASFVGPQNNPDLLALTQNLVTVEGAITGSGTHAQGFDWPGQASFGQGLFTVTNVGSSSMAGLTVSGPVSSSGGINAGQGLTASYSKFIVEGTSGNIFTSGTISGSSHLDVGGDLRVRNGGINLGGTIYMGGGGIQQCATISGSGDITMYGKLEMAGKQFIVQDDADLSSSGYAYFGDKLEAGGGQFTVQNDGDVSGSGYAYWGGKLEAAGRRFQVDSDGDTIVKTLVIDAAGTIGCTGDTDLLALTVNTCSVAGALTTTGRVGIGTGTPGYDLHINGAGVTVATIDGGSSSDAYLKFATNGVEKSYVKLGSGGNLSIVQDASGGDMIFKAKPGGASTEFLRYNAGDRAITASQDLYVVGDITSSHNLVVDGQVAVGGLHLDAKLNVSGSDIDKLISVKSDTVSPAFYVSGSGDLFISGNVGIGALSPTVPLDVNGNAIRIRTASTPSSASDFGIAGEIRWDANYIYVCVATDTWKRVAISTW